MKKKDVNILNADPSIVVYAYIEGAEMDCDGNGHIKLRKHRRNTMEVTVKEFRKHIGKSVAIYISGDKT